MKIQFETLEEANQAIRNLADSMEKAQHIVDTVLGKDKLVLSEELKHAIPDGDSYSYRPPSDLLVGPTDSTDSAEDAHTDAPVAQTSDPSADLGSIDTQTATQNTTQDILRPQPSITEPAQTNDDIIIGDLTRQAMQISGQFNANNVTRVTQEV